MAEKKNEMTPTNAIKITDTTFRDAHQSSFATRMRTEDMLPVAEQMDEIGWHSMEVWGGATFDVPTRFLNEDPWGRLKLLKKRMPKTPLQMLLRGQNLVGYRNYPDDVVREFILYTAECGLDIFRVFDALNDERNFEIPFKVIKEAGKHIQATICYSLTERCMGGEVYNLDYYVEKAKILEEMGADSLCIKDMAGIISPYDAYELVKALKEAVNIPIQLHTHYTSGMASMAYLKAIEAGVDIVDTALAPFALRTSQPAIEPLIVALECSPRAPGVDLTEIFKIGQYLENIAPKYREFLDTTKMAVIDTGVLLHQIPGGMTTNLVNQLRETNALHRINEVYEELPRTRKELGYPPLVTPTSQIVGVQAVLNVLMGRYKMISKEVRDYCYGLYGRSPAPIDKEVQKKALKGYPRGEEPITCRAADVLEPEMEKAREATRDIAKNDGDVLIYALYPQTGMRFLRWKYGLEPVPEEVRPKTLEEVKREDEIIKKALAGKLVEKPAKEVPAKGPGIRKYNIFVNGEYYSVEVEEEGVIETAPVIRKVTAVPKPEAAAAAPPKVEKLEAPAPKKEEEKAPPMGAGKEALIAPMPGLIVEVRCAVGDRVQFGDELVILEAMKMQNPLPAPVNGVVRAINVKAGDSVSVGEVLVVLE